MKSSIFKYSCSTAKISKQGKINRHVSLNVKTLRILSMSKINNSRSISVECIDGLPSPSVSDSLNNAYNNDCLGVRLSCDDESSSLLFSPLSWTELLFFSFGESSSRCRLMKSSMASSSSTSSLMGSGFEASPCVESDVL